MFVMVAVLICVAATSPPTEAQLDTWVANENPSFSLGDKVTSAFYTPGNRDCTKSTLQIQVLENTYSSSPIEQNIDACVVSNSLGVFGGGYVSPNTRYAYYVSATGSLVGVPNQPVFYLFDSSGEVRGSRLYYYNSLRTNGTFELMNSNYFRGFGYRFTNVRPKPLSDAVNSPLLVNEYAFSENGEWMVAEVLGIGFVRINTITGAQTLFSDKTYQYGLGYLPSLTMAISNDGKTAIASGKDATEATLFDVGSCQENVPFSRSSRLLTGCKSKSIENYIRTKVPGYMFLHSMRFTNDGRTINGVVVKSASPLNERYKFTLSLDAIDPIKPASYVALGDSFASGEGDMEGKVWYEPGTYEKGNNMCHLSRRSYPYLLSFDLEITNNFHSVACSGAIEYHITNKSQYGKSLLSERLGKWTPGIEKQKEFIRLSPGPPSIITVSIGGNDLGFADILTECVKPGTCSYADDQNKRGELAASIAREYRNLVSTYKEIAAASKNESKIYVIGYPQFVKESGGSCSANVHLNNSERVFIFNSVHYTNQVIKAAAETAGVSYVDIENSLEGRNLCSIVEKSRMAFNGLTEGNDKQIPWYSVFATQGGPTAYRLVKDLGIANESFHPNQMGHELMENAILAGTNGNPLTYSPCPIPSDIICPKPDVTIPYPDSAYFGTDAWKNVYALNGKAVIKVSPKPQQKDIISENINPRSARLNLQDMASSTTVYVDMFSTPTRLGTFTTSSNGTLETDLSIPNTVPPGPHTIHVYGTSFDGEPVDYYEKVYLTGPEGDINNNGTPDTSETCGMVEASGQDQDKDGIDDACDGFIGEAPPEPAPTPTPPPSDPIVLPPLPTDPIIVVPPTPDEKLGLNESSPETESPYAEAPPVATGSTPISTTVTQASTNTPLQAPAVVTQPTSTPPQGTTDLLPAESNLLGKSKTEQPKTFATRTDIFNPPLLSKVVFVALGLSIFGFLVRWLVARVIQ